MKRATPALKRRAIFVAPFRGDPAGDAKKIPAGYRPILEILKFTRFGINAALKEGNPRWNGGRNQNKQNQTENKYAK